uniref:DUF4384 domain-containing protein n=1 Tax=Salmonella enterica TaxID=28901 RepID=UPI003298B4D5
ETLHSGDRIRLRVEVDRRAYVRVVQLDKRGGQTLLFPLPSAEEAALLEAGVQTTIPSGGAMFELDDEAGEEEFLV